MENSIDDDNVNKLAEEFMKRFPSEKKEAVNHPQHYGGDNPYECIKVLENWYGKEVIKHFCLCNSIKYLCRLGKKDDEKQEIEKAIWYLNYVKEL